VAINNRLDINLMEAVAVLIMEAADIQAVVALGTLERRPRPIKEAVVDTQAVGAPIRPAAMRRVPNQWRLIREVVINKQLTKAELVGKDINRIRES